SCSKGQCCPTDSPFCLIPGLPFALGFCCGPSGAGYACCNENTQYASCISPANNDPNNCGACGNVCASGNCSNGKCCPVGLVNCGGTCLDANTDNSNCGSCGHVCSTGQSCSNGACCATVSPYCISINV